MAEIRRFVVVVLIMIGVATAGVLAPPPAAAEPSPPQVLDPPVVFTLPPEVTGCGFDVRIEATGKFKIIELPDGRMIITAPDQFATVTNLSTGTSVTLNITGSIRVSEAADGSTTFVATGRNLLWGGDENALVLARGRFTWTFDPAGNVSPQTGNGDKTDVCALVA
jgi:hypothetical protein